MIENIGGVVIFVKNQEKAIDFYSNKLGFEIKGKYPYKNSNWVELAPKNSSTTISLMEPNHDMIINGDIDYPRQEIGIMTNLWFYTNDISYTYKLLKEKGVNITEPKKQEWGGILSRIKDIDNNTLTLISSEEEYTRSN